MTKQKFRQTRKQEAFLSDPLKQLEKSYLKQEDASEDIDDIIKELEEKRKKKVVKGSMKHSREKFYTEL